MYQRVSWRIIVAAMLAAWCSAAQAGEAQFYRLFEGLTALVANPDGKDFTVQLDVRDLNLMNASPREVLYKVYDPDGIPVVREIIPDDGVASTNFLDRIGGWDHELQYFANLYEKGTLPSFRWSAWSDPGRLNSLVKRSFNREIKGGKKGVYRVVLAGCADHYVTLGFSPDLKYAVSGNPTFFHGHGEMLKKSFVYVPKGTSGIFFAASEPDMPRTRKFKLTAPDGKVFFDGAATGGYVSIVDKDSWQQATIKFDKPGQYDGQLLTVEVSPGANDYLLKITLQQDKAEPAFKDYVGMGSMAVFADDAETAKYLKAGTIVVDDKTFWQPFQVRFYQWLKANKLDADDKQKALRKELEAMYDGFRLVEISDGRGSSTWTNWAYAMGYYGFRVFRPGWLMMQRADVPADVKTIIKEGLIMSGDRLSFANALERVNGNAYSQINVALWYSMKATGDKIQQDRFETFFDRWRNGGWGTGGGLSKSGDSREHFAHDMHYGSYIMENWKPDGGTWVGGAGAKGILEDAKDEPRFKQVMDRYYELYSYLYCRTSAGTPVPANPWNSRTAGTAHNFALNWETVGGVKWKGEPGPDLTVSVNGGDEWFAARRKGYYAVTFHGQLAPEWMSRCFPGQLGFGGGILCQLTVPGKGPVLTSTLNGTIGYGEGMHISEWRGYHLHSIVGEKWDGEPFASGISEHDDAKLNGNVVASSGEIRNAGLRVARKYTYNPDSINCEVALSESDYARVLSIWSHERQWSEVKFAYEMIPYIIDATKPAKITVTDAAGKTADLGKAPVTAKSVRIDCGGYGVVVELEKPLPVKLGDNHTVLVLIAGKDGDASVPAEFKKPKLASGHEFIGVPASLVAAKYRLVPFGN